MPKYKIRRAVYKRARIESDTFIGAISNVPSSTNASESNNDNIISNISEKSIHGESYFDLETVSSPSIDSNNSNYVDNGNSTDQGDTDVDFGQSNNIPLQSQNKSTNNHNDLTNNLVEWAKIFNIHHNTLDSLLKILKPYHSELFIDSHTIMRTPRKLEIVKCEECAVLKILKLGGDSIYDSIFISAKRLITDEYAGATYSYLGRKGKKKFQDLNVAKVFLEMSMRREGATTKECEAAVAKWLRRCTERAKNKNQ